MVVVLGEGWIVIWGAFFHLLKIFMLYCAWVGLMWCVSICVVVIFLSMFCSSSGIFGFGVSVVWLCMQRMDVRDGSEYW